jgi:hypothetical protein
MGKQNTDKENTKRRKIKENLEMSKSQQVQAVDKL